VLPRTTQSLPVLDRGLLLVFRVCEGSPNCSLVSRGFGKVSIGGDTLKTCFSFFKARKQEGGEVCEAKSESLLDSAIIHFGFSAGAVQPVINVRGDELFAGRELIRKWSSRETAYWVSEKLGAMILD
jgi:hypothetical protein